MREVHISLSNLLLAAVKENSKQPLGVRAGGFAGDMNDKQLKQAVIPFAKLKVDEASTGGPQVFVLLVFLATSMHKASQAQCSAAAGCAASLR